MSQWLDSWSNHRVWRALDELDAALQHALAQPNAQDAAEALARLRSTHSLLKNHLNTTDSHFLWKELLDSFADNAEQAAKLTRSFAESADIELLRSALSTATGIINMSRPHSVPIVTEGLGAAKEATEAYRQSLNTWLNEARESAAEVRREIDSLRERIGELSNLVTAERANATSLTSANQSQFSKSIDAWRGEHAEALKGHERAAGEALKELLVVTSLARSEYADLKNGFENEIENTIESIGKEYNSKVDPIVDSIKLSKAEVEKMVGMTANVSLISGHKQTADAAGRQAFWWRIGAVFFLLALFGTSAYMATRPPVSTVDWSSIVSRGLASLSLVVLASYCAVEATRYQRQERENRKKELELAALPKYIADLPSEKQHEFRVKIGERMFGASEPAENVDASSPTNIIAGVNTVVKTVGDAAVALVKSKP